jgi:hypothetical protein
MGEGHIRDKWEVYIDPKSNRVWKRIKERAGKESPNIAGRTDKALIGAED